MLQKIIKKHLPVIVALIVLVGLSLHDTKLDTMTKFAIALPVMIASFEAAHIGLLSSEAHTHVERVSVGQFASRATAAMPNMTRRFGDGSFKLPQSVPKGHHPFDSYYLPAV